MGDQLQFESIDNFRRIPLTNMFRSARPDKINRADLDKFAKLKIQAIYDLRSLREYPGASGSKLADDVYQPAFVKISPEQPTTYKLIKLDKMGKQLPANAYEKDTQGKTHFVFDLLSDKYMRCVVRAMPFRHKIVVYFVAFLKKLFGGGFLEKLVVQLVINHEGLLGQYKNMIDYCGKEISTVLRCMSDQHNVPGVVCCAIGKDRTGIMSAILMSLCGADKHAIASDYNESEEFTKTKKEEVTASIKKYGLNQCFSEAKYGTMISLLDYIDKKYGSIPGYLCSIGFNHIDQERLVGNISAVVS